MPHTDHPLSCRCVPCILERQSRVGARSSDGAWIYNRNVALFSCYEHTEYTELHFPGQKVTLAPRPKCLFCNMAYEEDKQDVTL